MVNFYCVLLVGIFPPNLIQSMAMREDEIPSLVLTVSHSFLVPFLMNVASHPFTYPMWCKGGEKRKKKHANRDRPLDIYLSIYPPVFFVSSLCCPVFSRKGYPRTKSKHPSDMCLLLYYPCDWLTKSLSLDANQNTAPTPKIGWTRNRTLYNTKRPFNDNPTAQI